METINPFYIRYTSLPSYEEFYNNVMSKNILCVFPGELTERWNCRKDWILEDGKIDFQYLEDNYGDMECPVYKCNEEYFNSNPASSISLREYVGYWRKVIDCQHQYQENGLDILYLKDWHLFSDSCGKKDDDKDPKDKVFELPVYFEADYLNDYCVAKGLTDYKFVYLGPKGSSTPLHIDVFGSYSWSANICGRKRWLFIPSSQVAHLKELLGSLPQTLYSLPNFREICDKVQAFEFVQNPGETVFVPSGFMHEVHNLEDTISINHNWFNACNLDRILQSLQEAFKDVEKEIIDLKDELSKDEWLESCDKIMIIHFGMNFEMFSNILQYNVERIGDGCLPDYSRFRWQMDITKMKEVWSKLNNEKEYEKDEK